METLIVLGIVAGAVLAIGLYVGELVVIGWIMDFRLAGRTGHARRPMCRWS